MAAWRTRLLGLVLVLLTMTLARAVPADAKRSPESIYVSDFMNTRWEPVKLTVGRKPVPLTAPARIAFSNLDAYSKFPTMAVFEGSCGDWWYGLSVTSTLIETTDVFGSSEVCSGTVPDRFRRNGGKPITYRRQSKTRMVLTLAGRTSLELRKVDAGEAEGLYSYVPERSTGPALSGEASLALMGWRLAGADGCNRLTSEYAVVPVVDPPGAWRLRRFGYTQITARACPISLEFDGVVIAADGTFTVTTPEGYIYSFARQR